MEKHKAHYLLAKLKELFSDPKTFHVTEEAFSNAVLLGYTNIDEMLDIVKSLENRHLYKAMTTHRNHKIWQDVYKITVGRENKIYLKLQLSVDGKKAILIQFKEDTGD